MHADRPWSLAKRLLSPVNRFSARMQDEHLGDISAYVPDIPRMLVSDPSLPSRFDVCAPPRQSNQRKLIAAFIQATFLCRVKLGNRPSDFWYSQGKRVPGEMSRSVCPTWQCHFENLPLRQLPR